MSGGLVKEYLIGFGFQIDEAGAATAVDALNSVLDAAKLIEPQVRVAAAALSSLGNIPPFELSFDFPEAEISGFAERARLELSRLDLEVKAPPIALSLDATGADVAGFVERARAALSGLSLDVDISGFLSSVASARAALNEFAGQARSELEGMKGMEVSVNTAPLSAATAEVARASEAMRSEMGAARNAVYSVADAGNSFSSLSGAAASAFRSVASSAQSQMKSAAAAVASYVQKMKASLASLSAAMGKAGAPGAKFGAGGMVERETQATIGEDGREYVIPVTKPDRAIPLLMAAMKDLNLESRAAISAVRQLGGSATANKAPVYVTQGAKRETVNNSVVHHNVSAPATINVYGNDAESVAKCVERNQEMLLIRNIKGVYA